MLVEGWSNGEARHHDALNRPKSFAPNSVYSFRCDIRSDPSPLMAADGLYNLFVLAHLKRHVRAPYRAMISGIARCHPSKPSVATDVRHCVPKSAQCVCFALCTCAQQLCGVVHEFVQPRWSHAFTSGGGRVATAKACGRTRQRRNDTPRAHKSRAGGRRRAPQREALRGAHGVSEPVGRMDVDPQRPIDPGGDPNQRAARLDTAQSMRRSGRAAHEVGSATQRPSHPTAGRPANPPGPAPPC